METEAAQQTTKILTTGTLVAGTWQVARHLGAEAGALVEDNYA